MCVCVCVCMCVYVCVCRVCVCVRERERERESACLFLCVFDSVVMYACVPNSVRVCAAAVDVKLVNI